MPSLYQTLPLVLLSTTTLVSAQTVSSSDGGYTGYTLGVRDDTGDSTIYQTDETSTTNSSVTVPPPDVYLNASVSVGEIDITVQNLTAKINLEAQVLSLLDFNAGVDVSIDQVDLTIQNVTAKVLLEARLGNLVTMIGDVLDSIDLNPVIASLGSAVDEIGSDVGGLVNNTLSGVTGAVSNLTARSFDVLDNVLYSVNDYSGNTHTNRILEQDGSIVDQYLDNDGNVHGSKVVGSYLKDMTYSGHNQSAVVDGQNARRLEYVYTPFSGLNVVAAITVNSAGTVIAARVLSEASAGGSSTIGNA